MGLPLHPMYRKGWMMADLLRSIIVLLFVSLGAIHASAQTGNCCQTGGNGSPGCNNAACQAAICGADPFCCNTTWDGICSTAALNNANAGGACAGVSNCPGAPPPPANTCCTANSTPGCENAACQNAICAADPFCCSTLWDTICAGSAITNANAGGACAGVSNCPGSPPPPANTCCTANSTPGCENAACQTAICATDPFCCNTLWDSVCAGAAVNNANSGGACAGVSNCPGTPGGGGGCAPGVGGGAFPGSGSIQIQQNLTPIQLIQDVFLGECLTASNVQYTGSPAAIGTFTNGWRIGIESGIILTSGSAALAVGPNAGGATGQNNFMPGHPLLTSLAGSQTYDAAVFQFSFVPQTESVTFTYAFGSDEYPEWVCQFNDVFGFFVSGPGYAANTNIATIPGTTFPVSIDNINNVGGCPPNYPAYYVNNTPGVHNEYDGFTVPLTACINTVPCETYTIIIAVADAVDGVFDSAVFLAAESFSAGVDLQIGATADQVTVSDEDNCVDYGYFIFTIDEPLGQDVTLTYTVDQIGDAVYDPPIPFEVTFPAGQTTVILPVNALPGSLGPDVSSVTINLDTSQNPLLGCSCTAEFVSTTLYFCEVSTLPVTWLGFDAHTINDERAVLCDWQTASEMNNDLFTVERSSDLMHWQDIGSIPGAGTTFTAQTYQFIDHSPLEGVAYYRIRQTDIDGGVDHSVVRTIHRGEPTRFLVFPNPGTDVFWVSGHAGGELAIYDLSGRRVSHTLLTNGELSLHGAAAGVYLVELRRETGTEPERLRLVVH